MRLPAFLDRSVRRKLTAIVVATTLAALVVAAVALVAYNRSDYRERALVNVRIQAEIIGRASAPALAFNDPEEAAKDLAMLDAREDLVQAAIYSKDGKLFASFAKDGNTSAMPAWTSAIVPGIEGERLTLLYPIVEGGQQLGAVVLITNYGLRARARFRAYLVILGGVMALALVAALLLSSWLQRAVTEPILQLTDAARAVVERRDFSVRAGKTTADEIGVLADAMNRMLADLEREIEERRGAEEALRVHDQRKDEFLATLAHELRNPLAPIKNALYLMQLTDDPKMLAEAKAIIDRQVRQMVRLVDDLLEVSRITTGRLALRREVVDLRTVAMAALEAVEPIMRERGHHVSVELPPPGLTINADPTRLAQVFINLLGNAAKFTDPGGRIDFRLEVKHGEMIGRVSDDGVGLPKEMTESIFEMFAQVDRSLERNTSGLGVGLSISRKLIELHGGTLEARSDGIGQGAEFTVHMPVDEAVAKERELEESGVASTASAEHRPRVLVVDDNKDFALSLGRMVQSLGYDVLVEHDGLAGLAAAQAIHPRIAFLDIGMPKLNGYELAKRLRSLPATATCILIAVTGWGQASDRQRAREAGFDEHMVKPLELDQLLKLLGRIA